MIIVFQIILGRILLIFCCNDNLFLKSCKKIFDVLIVAAFLIGIIGLFYALPTNETIQESAIKNFLPSSDNAVIKFVLFMSFLGIFRYPLYIGILDLCKKKIFTHDFIRKVITLIQFYFFFKLFQVLCSLILLLMSMNYKII